MGVSLPASTPVRVRVGPHPPTGVESATTVVALGRFDHDNRTKPGSYSEAVYAAATGDTTITDPMGARLHRVVSETMGFDSIDSVVVVPNHDGGTNPALAAIAASLPAPATQIVRRTRAVDPNKTVENPEDRWRNVADSYSVTTPLDGDAILVLDDVLASGASLGTTAATLRAAGAATVSGAVLGLRVPNPHDPEPVSGTEARRTS